jgi:hypothetical protein
MELQLLIEKKFVKAIQQNNYLLAQITFDQIEEPFDQKTNKSLIREVFDNWLQTKDQECIDLAKHILNVGFSFKDSDFDDIELLYNDFEFIFEGIGYSQIIRKNKKCKIIESGDYRDLTLCELLILKGHSKDILRLIKANKLDTECAITRDTIFKVISLKRNLSNEEVRAFLKIIQLTFKNVKNLLEYNEKKELKLNIDIDEFYSNIICPNKVELFCILSKNILKPKEI